jgi:hypothetical protein
MRRMRITALVVAMALSAVASTARADAVYPVSTECSVTDEWMDCAGMTWQRETCTTTYNNGAKVTTAHDSPAPWECWTCYMMYFC